MKDPKVITLKSGRLAMTGICPVCDTLMWHLKVSSKSLRSKVKELKQTAPRKHLVIHSSKTKKRTQLVKSTKGSATKRSNSSETLKTVKITEDQLKYFKGWASVKSVRGFTEGGKKYFTVTGTSNIATIKTQKKIVENVVNKNKNNIKKHIVNEKKNNPEENVELYAEGSVRFRTPGAFLIRTKTRAPWRYTDHPKKRR